MKIASKDKEINAGNLEARQTPEPVQSERHLKLVEELIKTLCAISPIGMYIIQDRKFQYVNPKFQELTGFSEDELVETNPAELVIQAGREQVRSQAIAMLKRKRTDPYEYRVFNKAGEIRNIMETVASIQYGGRRAVLGNYMDITERKQAEEALKESEERYRDLFENANDLIQSVMPDGHFVYVNKSWKKVLGYNEAEMANLTLWDIIHPDYIDHCVKIFHNVMSGKRVNNVEAVFITKDGRSVPVEGHVNCRFKDGKPVATRGIFRDVTERKRAEEALRESEENFRALAENSNDGISITDFSGEIGKRVYVNDRLCEITGFTAEELINMPFLEMFSPDKREQVRGIRKNRLAGKPAPKYYEATILKKDGTSVPIEATATHTIWHKEPAIMGVFRDITERKQDEEALRESEERYRDLFENANDLIQSVMPDGHFVYVNKSWKKVLGYNEAEMANLTLWDIIHPDYIDHCVKIFHNVMSGKRVSNVEAVFITKEGRSVPVEGHVSCRFEEGKPVATRGIFRDVTERKRAEEARDEVEHLKSEFLSNITHELRSPLHSIRGFTNLMLDGKVPDPETRQEFLTIIDKQGQHLTSLVDNLLDMSRLEAGRFTIQKQLTSIEDIIHNTIEAFYAIAEEKGIIITENIQPALPDIEVDEERIKQVMMNLLGNALKFTKGAEPVSVKAETRNGSLLVQVTDHGIGIPEEAMPRLFERFQQVETASRIGGTGLGLYISRQIIEAHGGHIQAKSKENQGSTFSFTLPLVKEGGNSNEQDNSGRRG